MLMLWHGSYHEGCWSIHLSWILAKAGNAFAKVRNI